MNKLEESNSAIVYRKENDWGMWALLVVPVGFAINYLTDGSWTNYMLVALIAVTGLIVGQAALHMRIDFGKKEITCSRMIYGRTTASAIIPFGEVTCLSVRPRYDRNMLKLSAFWDVVKLGNEIAIEWKAAWGGGEVVLEKFRNEPDARVAAERLGQLIGVPVVVRQLPEPTAPEAPLKRTKSNLSFWRRQ